MVDWDKKTLNSALNEIGLWKSTNSRAISPKLYLMGQLEFKTFVIWFYSVSIHVPFFFFYSFQQSKNNAKYNNKKTILLGHQFFVVMKNKAS